MDTKRPEDEPFDDALERTLDKGVVFRAPRPITTNPEQRIVQAGKSGELSGIHVLVIDDDYEALDMMQNALQYAGALVTAVQFAEKAFEVLSRVTPDVILTDLRMPTPDGLAFARELQQMPSLRSIPLLAVTGFEELYVRQELHAAGFIGILRKPITFSDLVRAVAALTEAAKEGETGTS